MKVYFVYILECKDGSFYTGVTNNVFRRFMEHKMGMDSDSYIYKRRPLKLVFYCEFTDVSMAIDKEKKIKGWSRAKKKSLIEGRFEDLINLTKKKF